MTQTVYPANLSLRDLSHLTCPEGSQQSINLKSWHTSHAALMIAKLAQQRSCPLLLITEDLQSSQQLAHELRFYLSDTSIPIKQFPDWETLPYDRFSPHQDIISERLRTLAKLPSMTTSIVIAAASTLMHRISPPHHITQRAFALNVGDRIDPDQFRQQLTENGYYAVNQVLEHGEFALRGSIIDLFPMGANIPFRIDLFDDEIDSIRCFNPDTQLTISKLDKIELLPAHEYPTDQAAITHFRQSWHEQFSGDPSRCSVYNNMSQGHAVPGIEYYLPLFFDDLATVFEYLPASTCVITLGNIETVCTQHWKDIKHRHEQLDHDINHPILPPSDVFIDATTLLGRLKSFPRITIKWEDISEDEREQNIDSNIESNEETTAKARSLPTLTINRQQKYPLTLLNDFVEGCDGRVLLCVESLGRREVVSELLREYSLSPTNCDDWHTFLNDTANTFCICISPLNYGFKLNHPNIAIITETDLFGEQVQQRRLRKKSTINTDALIRDLTELKINDPVVHIEHGIGRYQGLQTIRTGDIDHEYITLTYANDDKLYIPVTELDLLSRYSGIDKDNIRVHHLGSQKWQQQKKKAQEKICDVAAELLDIYARRQAKIGIAFSAPDLDYERFASEFPFELTPDQLTTIEAVIEDMKQTKAMDRLVCGDVGFGKTEVAMRAAFIAVHDNKQVAVLVPTTLLAEQHLQTFTDRFASWPVRVACLSRFRTKQEQESIIQQLANGKIDIVIGTHRLIQSDIKF